MKPFTKPSQVKNLADLTGVFREIEKMPFNRSQTCSISDSGTVDTEFEVSHNLGRIPNGYLVTSIDVAGIIYIGTTAWTTTAIYLKCNAANAAITLQVF